MSSYTFLELSKHAIAMNFDLTVLDVDALWYYPTPTGYYGVFTSCGGNCLFTIKYANDDARFSITKYNYENSIEF